MYATVGVEQLSLAVDVPTGGTDVHSTVTFAGTLVNTGAVVSCTFIVCVLVVLLPQASVASHFLVKV